MTKDLHVVLDFF